MKDHLIIGGTGRAGTSLLVKYLTECGLETHISRNEKAYWEENAMAGLEDLPLAGSDSPYVVKTPWLFECVDDLVKRKDIAIDAVIIPCPGFSRGGCQPIYPRIKSKTRRRRVHGPEQEPGS